jgi:hypothetical protein
VMIAKRQIRRGEALGFRLWALGGIAERRARSDAPYRGFGNRQYWGMGPAKIAAHVWLRAFPLTPTLIKKG